MGAFAIVFMFISGYLFVSRSDYQRYITSREYGHRYYFRCCTIGFISCITGLTIEFILDTLNIPSYFLQLLNTSIEQSYIHTSHLTFKEYLALKFFFGLSLGMPLSWIGAKIRNRCSSPDISLSEALNRKNISLEKFIYQKIKTLETVLITLSSRKIYVGILHNMSLGDREIEYLVILPVLSGYRDKDKLTVSFTTNYYFHYAQNLDDNGEPINGNGASLNDFVEIIPVTQVTHIGSFNLKTYKQFIKDKSHENLGSSHSR